MSKGEAARTLVRAIDLQCAQSLHDLRKITTVCSVVLASVDNNLGRMKRVVVVKVEFDIGLGMNVSRDVLRHNDFRELFFICDLYKVPIITQSLTLHIQSAMII